MSRPNERGAPRGGRPGRGAIVHEWVEPIGGSENVVDAFARLYPYSELWSLWSNAPERYPRLSHYESALARSPLRDRKALALPWMSAQWRAADLRDRDWVLISSHAFAHHVGAGRHQAHLERFVYVHSPARYLWAPDIDPRGSHPLVRAAAPALRRQDRRHVRPGHFASNSAYVAERVRRAWGVESEVIHPPVGVSALQARSRWADVLSPQERDQLEALPQHYLLGASRFVEYKGLHRVLDIAADTGQAVVLAGRGPEEQSLRDHARRLGVDAHFVVSPGDAMLRAVVQRAQVLVFPPVEDFGIVPAEAVALGTPVLVHDVGGAQEIVGLTDGGVVADLGRPGAWREALHAVGSIDMAAAAEAVGVLSEERFEQRILEWMRDSP